ncbi:hypothetical protein FPQ18DRAFT_364854 [Pyronema domesticum]|uniref:Similar to Rho guanine nucleotide exchange factor scd1 acc. no. P40995 n=1 Tax=Pyronema omphalodes (strain CBS 100304) TaxID=1076935 RepID=U4LT07_PYROM|nr:hypothetical protein FPQ18DRAFT_364854 [Pyronema domesticum]CCX30511.1 Similar to Rho guanine nucleotide exchange factor scd1; acc. no. P40995 [Pyronema omphalodes CBS 100304]
MTVESEQDIFLRHSVASAPRTMTTIGTPAAVPNGANNVGSPTVTVMGIPQANDNIINKKADPAQGLFQTCLTLRQRLQDVPGFEKFLEPPEDADPNIPEDPVTQLWRCFRLGSSLCALFNATQPKDAIREDRLSPNLKTMNDCKAATFHFLKGIKTELDIQGEDAFMIHNLYSDDTNGFVKVTKTVTKILDILKERDLLIVRDDADQNADNGEKKPLDNRARIVKELVDTERKYVQDLEALQDYMRCLEREEVVSKDLIHNLFLNLNQLVDFQRRFLIRVETQNSLSEEQQNWGHLFVQYEKSFTVYEPYASNFNGAQHLAQEAREQLARMPHPVFDQLAAFLIKPVQRVTKYPLLLRDLIKQTPPVEAMEKELPLGLAAIERITSAINEAIRKSENIEIVKDLEGRVEDWKGHKLEHFGELLLHGQFSVIKGDQKGDVEREYYIYLFERILLCCKEMGVGKKQNKTMSMGKSAKPPPGGKKRTSLQLKGRIFMQNVTDVVSIARNGSYTLQIFWKGDPGVENFMIKHTNEEGLTHWKKILQKQRETFTKNEASTTGRQSGQSTASTQFAWMGITNNDPEVESRNASDDDDDATIIQDQDRYSALSGTTLSSSRNGSMTNLRSRSATNENMPPPNGAYMRGPTSNPPARFPIVPNGHTPPLTLNTNPLYQNLANSPERSNASYFSPVETPMLTSRSSSASGQAYPFPRYPQSQYYDESGPQQFSPPSMSRSSSREGSSGTQQYTAFQSSATAYANSSRLQRPSLPGMGTSVPSISGLTQHQSRMRSASSPNIHHIPGAASQLSRVSPGGNIPPIPTIPTSVPGSYIPYSGGPAVIQRQNSDSPTSPGLPIQGPRAETPTGDGSMNGVQQVKVKVHSNTDLFVLVVPYNIAYAQLIDRIERKVEFCGALPATPIRVRYQDEDGDYISMNSDDDVQMAFDAGCENVDPNQGGLTVTLYLQLG